MKRELRGRGSIVVLFAILLLLASACGQPDIVYKNLTQSEWDRLPQQLSRHADIFAQRGVQLRSSYQANEQVFVEVRKLQAPWNALSAEETEQLKQDLFKAVGYSFDLQIDSFVLPKQADITGTITALDVNRVLVVGPAAEGSNPNAVWITFPNGMTEELRIGYEINAWSDGMVEESHPSQTGGLQMQVVDFSVGTGELEGVITDLFLEDPNIEKRYIEVDHKRFRLLPFTKYRANGEAGTQGSLRIGVKVQVWTLGYEIMADEKFASQINELTSK